MSNITRQIKNELVKYEGHENGFEIHLPEIALMPNGSFSFAGSVKI